MGTALLASEFQRPQCSIVNLHGGILRIQPGLVVVREASGSSLAVRSPVGDNETGTSFDGRSVDFYYGIAFSNDFGSAFGGEGSFFAAQLQFVVLLLCLSTIMGETEVKDLVT